MIESVRSRMAVALALVAVLVMAAAPVALADQNRGSGKDGAAGTVKVEGTIRAIRRATNTVIIRTRAGANVLVVVDAQTKLERNERDVALSALKVGDRAE